MVQRTSPDDYKKGEWGYLQGFVPENDTTMRSQWPIQSVGNFGPDGASGSDDDARNWKPDGRDGTEPVDTSDVISVYPIRAASGTFLIAIKANGTIWWTKASASDADYSTTNACDWKRVGYNSTDNCSYAENKGFSIYQDWDNQPNIIVEVNPDYRFICDLPLEVYKYIKKPQPPSRGPLTKTITNTQRTATVAIYTIGTHGYVVNDLVTVSGTTRGSGTLNFSTPTAITAVTSTTFSVADATGVLASGADTGSSTVTTPYTVGAPIVVNGSNGGWLYDGSTKEIAALPTEGDTTPNSAWFLDFTKDALPDAEDSEETGSITGTGINYTRSISSAVLIHSRRYYRDGRLTRGKDYDTKKTVTNKATTTNTTKVLTVGSGHGFSNDDLIEVFIDDANYDGFQQITASDATTITYIGIASTNESTAVTGATRVVQKYHRNQTAVVAYVDPYSDSVKAVTFPNFRRWPMYPIKTDADYAPTAEKDQSKLFNAEYRPMPSWVVLSNKTQGSFPFIDEYPYEQDTESITSPDIDFNDGSTAVGTSPKFKIRGSYPKYNTNFHAYTYLNIDKSLLPGRGLMPRAFTGTMLGSILILGDVEWKQDSANAFTSDKRLVPTKNKVAGASSNSNFGLRDSNTEPHRGFFYYSQDDIDIFDPRSILRASGTDTRIAGMHTINNRVITITTSGGQSDGIVSFSGNFGALHPYTPGVLANPLAVRKELILGGVGTADTEDWYNHGNPQTCLWAEFGKVAFIDKTGYVFTTNGETADMLDDRFPLFGKPSESTVNDHVASIGKYLFVYKNGYLFVYTIQNGRGAWYTLIRPQAFWEVRTAETGYTQHYNVIKSMRGIGNELYFVVQSYWIDCDSDYEPLENAQPILGASRVMRFSLNGPSFERGKQDGYKLDGLDIITPTMGLVAQSKKVFWRQAGVNFYTEHGCEIIGAGTVASYPFDTAETVKYDVPGTHYETALPNMTIDFTPTYSNPLQTYTEGFHNFEMSTGVGPQRVLSARFSFRGDVVIEGVNIFFTGEYDLAGDA